MSSRTDFDNSEQGVALARRAETPKNWWGRMHGSPLFQVSFLPFDAGQRASKAYCPALGCHPGSHSLSQPGLFNAVTSVGGAGLRDAKLASDSLTALYACFAVSGLLGGSVANYLGLRATLCIGSTGYSLYIAALLTSHIVGPKVDAFVITAGCILGITAASCGQPTLAIVRLLGHGRLVQQSSRLAYYNSLYKGLQSAENAVFWRLDSYGVPFMTMLVATWASLGASLVLAAPMIIFRIRDFTTTDVRIVETEEQLDETTYTTIGTMENAHPSGETISLEDHHLRQRGASRFAADDEDDKALSKLETIEETPSVLARQASAANPSSSFYEDKVIREEEEEEENAYPDAIPDPIRMGMKSFSL
ncbi:hypothetical protein L7F22_006409 [Adiantum nelumboides]|nr:hypothetical protein [Adiantum nelumboides]